MRRIDHVSLSGPGFLFRAAAAWAISAALLVLLGALLLSLLHAGEEALAYVSAAVSFFAAFAAGLSAARTGAASRFAVGMISGGALCILLLTLGFLIHGGDLDASAVLSVASFTVAGALSGALLSALGGKKRRKNAAIYRVLHN